MFTSDDIDRLMKQRLFRSLIRIRVGKGRSAEKHAKLRSHDNKRISAAKWSRVNALGIRSHIFNRCQKRKRDTKSDNHHRSTIAKSEDREALFVNSSLLRDSVHPDDIMKELLTISQSLKSPRKDLLDIGSQLLRPRSIWAGRLFWNQSSVMETRTCVINCHVTSTILDACKLQSWTWPSQMRLSLFPKSILNYLWCMLFDEIKMPVCCELSKDDRQTFEALSRVFIDDYAGLICHSPGNVEQLGRFVLFTSSKDHGKLIGLVPRNNDEFIRRFKQLAECYLWQEEHHDILLANETAIITTRASTENRSYSPKLHHRTGIRMATCPL